MRREILLAAGVIVLSHPCAWGTAAEAYDPSWASELGWANSQLWQSPLGSSVWWQDAYAPWWQTQVAHPILDYEASQLPAGVARLDSAVQADVTFHRLLPGWSKQASPSNINNVYTFIPTQDQEDQTARSGQDAFFDLGLHPLKNFSADIGAELQGNYDQRYAFPVNDEHRMFNNDVFGRIVRAQAKYDDGTFMARGFEGVPINNWMGQNDLFGLLPSQQEVEYYRNLEGTVSPRGGEMSYKSSVGTLDVLGGTEIRWGYGSSVFAKYDLPTFGPWENSFVYRNENIPFGQEGADERRWTVSYNSSYAFSDRVTGHLGLLYQPFRLDRTYEDADSDGGIQEDRTMQRDALGGTVRTEVHPTRLLDLAGLGYTYLGPVAGDKQQVDVNGSRTFLVDWTLSAAYSYRQPIKGPVPLEFEGTPANPGAFISVPRGPDDPFQVQWDNRKAHLLSLTLVYDPTPATAFFKYQPNVLDDWNLNPDEDAPWTAAVQYRLTHYLTNTDRLFYWDENRNLIWEPVSYTDSGALATAHPFSSATGLVRWTHDKWHVTADLSGGEALAGLGLAYTAATTSDKPSTIYMSGGFTVNNGPYKAYFRYGKDLWGPLDYQVQNGWTYHHIYQAGFSVTFLQNAEAGFRYIGTRMTDEFIGADIAAFNEYTFFLSYHFGLQHNFHKAIEGVGQPLPKTFPEVSATVSDVQFTPDGSGPTRVVLIYPHASADAGILSYQVFVRNSRGETVHTWAGNGVPPASLRWDGLDENGKPLPAGAYRITVSAVDLYGNEASSPAQSVDITSAGAAAAYRVTQMPQGLRVTLSSQVLFDVDKINLRDSAKDGLRQVVELLKAYPTNKLRVSGYTDSSGSAKYNQTLSEERARAVADYLIQQGGIAGSRIQAKGYGKRRPVASNATEEGRQQNRRVEIDILK